MAIERLRYILGIEGDRAAKRKLKAFANAVGESAKAVVGSFGRMVAGFANFRSMVVVGMAYAVGRFAASAMNMGEQSRLLGQSFENLAAGIGQNSRSILDSMKKGMQGTVSEMKLMGAANNAILLGLPVTAKEMGKLSEVAIRLGRAMGRGPVEALNDMVVGIGRQSRMILDNLGIIVSIEKANDAYAESLGKTVKQLTDVEKKQAFYNAAMGAAIKKADELKNIAGGYTDVVAKMGVAWENLSIRIGNSIIPTLSRILEMTTEMIRLAESVGGGGGVPRGDRALEGRFGGAGYTFQAGRLRHPGMPQPVPSAQDIRNRQQGVLPEMIVTAPRRTRAELGGLASLGTEREILEAGGRDAVIADWQAITEAEREAADELEQFNLDMQNLEPAPDIEISELSLDLMAGKVDEAIVPAFEAGPKAMEDQFGRSFARIEAQMVAMGMRGASIFGGIANIRAGAMGITPMRGGEIGWTKALSDLGRDMGSLGQAVQGLVTVQKGLKGAIGGLWGIGGGDERAPLELGQTASEEAQQEHAQDISQTRVLIGVLEAMRTGDRQFTGLGPGFAEIAGAEQVTAENVTELISRSQAQLESLVAGGASGGSQTYRGVTTITEAQGGHLSALAETARIQDEIRNNLLRDIKGNTLNTANNTGVSAGMAMMRFSGI